MSVWLRFVLAVLATWRVAHLLAYEDGPADLLFRIRRSLGNGVAGRLLDCFDCLTLWVAAPLALLVRPKLPEWLLVWLALSGAACLLERGVRQPVVFRRTLEMNSGDASHGMLRREERRTEEETFTRDEPQ